MDRLERRRLLLAILAGSAFPHAALARMAARVAYLSGLSAETSKSWLAAFREGLRELGYQEGRNLVIDERYASGRFDLLPGFAAELVERKADVFLIYSAEAARAASAATRTVPIVLANVGDPVAAGLVKSLARPGGNITGLSDYHGASVTKRLELLKEIAPSASRVAVLWRPGQASHPAQLRDVESAAAALRFAAVPLPVTSLRDIEEAFGAMQRERAGALLVLGDVLLTTHHARIARLALERRLPAMYTIRPFVLAGGLIAYGANFGEMFRRSASYVDRILKGASPAELPIEQPTKFDLRINLRTAKALGLSVPRSVLLRADEVIE